MAAQTFWPDVPDGVNAVWTPPRQLCQSPSPPQQSCRVDAESAARQAFENQLKGDCEDAVQIWYDYASWAREHCSPSEAAEILSRACYSLMFREKHCDDPRYVQLWVKHAATLDDLSQQCDLFEYVEEQGIGLKRTLLYEAWASVLEKRRAFLKAEQIYQRGIEREAIPSARLHKSKLLFHERMEQRAARDDISAEELRAERQPPSTCGVRVEVLSGKENVHDAVRTGGDVQKSAPLAKDVHIEVRSTPSMPVTIQSTQVEAAQSGALTSPRARMMRSRLSSAASDMTAELTTHCVQALFSKGCRESRSSRPSTSSSIFEDPTCTMQLAKGEVLGMFDAPLRADTRACQEMPPVGLRPIFPLADRNGAYEGVGGGLAITPSCATEEKAAFQVYEDTNEMTMD